MSDRHTTFLGAIAALLILVGLLYVPSSTDTISRPTTEESGRNGYLGLKRWLDKSGIATLSFRQRMGELHTDQRITPHGNVMITTLPYAKPMREGELSALHSWVASGNTLLVLAALDDSADWTLITPSEDFLDTLKALTGLAFAERLDEEEQPVMVGEFFKESRHYFSPVSEHPLMTGVESLVGVSDSISWIWAPQLEETPEFVIRMATEDEHDSDALWQLPRGRGQFIVSARSSLLSNRLLAEADNAVLLSNILAWHLGVGGTVLFDDIHQGLTDLYEPSDFFADQRLHNSVWFIIVFWLLYLLGGGSRLAPLREPPMRSSQQDLVAAIGGFMARKLSRSDAGLAMVEAWLSGIWRSGHLSIGSQESPPWDELEYLPLVDSAVLRNVRESYRRLGRGEKVDLAELHNNILILKRNMA